MKDINFPGLNHREQITYLTVRDGTRLRVLSVASDESSKGIVILVNGHREFMEKYDEFFSEILDRNFAVYSLDNRGQGLSDRLLPNRLKSYAEDFDVFPADLDQFISEIVMTDPRGRDLPIYLIGHSMGGHICLRYLHDFPGVISKAIIMAPMIEFNLGGGMARAILKVLIRLASRTGFKKKFAFFQGNLLSENIRLIKQKRLTHDIQRYAEEAHMISRCPDLYVGGATFGWLNAALESIKKINFPGYFTKISVPLLVLFAGEDKVVDSKVGRELLSGHDNINIVTIEGARHEIYRESDVYRDRLWQEIDQFLRIE